MRPCFKALGCFVFWMLARPQFAQQRTVDERFFVDRVYKILEKAECRMCHNDNGVSSATRLKFPPSEAKTEAIEIFGLKLSALVDRQNVAQSLLLNKPTMRIPHTGGVRIPKGGAEVHEHAEANSHKTSGMTALLAGHAGGLKTGQHSVVTGTIGDLYLTLADEVMGAQAGKFPSATRKLSALV
jgi:hypothetical protein